MKRIKKYLPFIIFFLISLFLHFIIKLNTGDDIWFSNVLNKQSIFEYLSFRYYNWTSRLIIETALVYLSRNIFLWRILDSIVFALIPISISILFNKKKEFKLDIIIILLTLLFPFNEMNSAGFISTTLNYLWPLSFGLISLIPISKICYEKNFKWYEFLLYIPAFIYACNAEQMCAIIFSLYFIFTIYNLYKTKKLSKICVLFLIISFMSLLFIILTPGNASRNAIELSTWYPDYKTLSIIDKITLGIIPTVSYYVSRYNMIFIVFSLLLCYIAFKNKKSIENKIISLIPIILLILFKISKYTGGYLLYIKNIFADQSLAVNATNYNNISSYFLIIISFTILFSIMYSLKESFKNYYYILLVFLAGFCSRFIMGFSPTIFSSSIRTFTYFNLVLIIILLYIIKDYKIYKNNKMLFLILILIFYNFIYIIKQLI